MDGDKRAGLTLFLLTMMGPWLGVGACSNMLSASSSVSGGGGRGGARLPYPPPPLGGGGRGGASPSEEVLLDGFGCGGSLQGNGEVTAECGSAGLCKWWH